MTFFPCILIGEAARLISVRLKADTQGFKWYLVEEHELPGETYRRAVEAKIDGMEKTSWLTRS